MSLPEAIYAAVKHLQASPPNEAVTCDWVIVPLLRAVGYELVDIIAKNSDAGGQFPDYTLLPNHKTHKFYLEAKAAHKQLEGGHAIQALNYANQNGKRWVVLSNGWEWRLYDNDVRGVADEKLVAQANLRDLEKAERFLRAIGKESVLDGRLSGFVDEQKELRRRTEEALRAQERQAARQQDLAAILGGELLQRSSGLLHVIRSYLAARPGLEDVTVDEICACLKGKTPAEVPDNVVTTIPQTSFEANGELLVVPASSAWPDYKRLGAYICQEKRSFRATTHIAFYCDGAIETLVPRILGSIESVLLTKEGVTADRGLSSDEKTKLLHLMAGLESGPNSGHLWKRQKVLFLSSPTSNDTFKLPHRIVNDKKDKNGKPWAFAVGHTYVSMEKLKALPKTTSGLVSE